jgi:gamma-glutamyl-gamma-aminobutyrate hydrolase PuuD
MDKIALISMKSENKNGTFMDCIDRKYYSLASQILGEKSLVIPLPNIGRQVNSYIEKIKPSLIILSGGNDLSCVPYPINKDSKRDLTETQLLKASFGIPVIGICRGMQIISTFFGSKLTEVQGHIASNHQVHSLIRGDKSTKLHTNSFHKWGIREDDLSKELVPIHVYENTIESFKHKTNPWLGVMWHPERSNQNSKSRLWVKNEISKYL